MLPQDEMMKPPPPPPGAIELIRDLEAAATGAVERGVRNFIS